MDAEQVWARFASDPIFRAETRQALDDLANGLAVRLDEAPPEPDDEAPEPVNDEVKE